MPAVNNTWAVIGGIGVSVLVAVLEALNKFFATGDPWPVDVQGWLRIIVPALVVGLIAALTPHYSATERRTGFRPSREKRGDAPVMRITREGVPEVPQPES